MLGSSVEVEARFMMLSCRKDKRTASAMDLSFGTRALLPANRFVGLSRAGVPAFHPIGEQLNLVR